MRVFRFLAVLLVLFTMAVAAQIPVDREPHHRVVYQNADLRVLDLRVATGEATLDHRHEFDIVTVSMSAGTRTRVKSAGQPDGEIRAPRPLGDATVAEYAGKPASHLVETLGDTAYQLFAVENLRSAGWSGGSPLSALATAVTADTRAFHLYDVRLVRTSPQTTHTHASPTIAVLIGGIVLSEGSDAQAKALAPAPVGLKRLDQPGQWVLVPRGESHTVVRLGTVDARLVEIEVR
jgi:hypothetical protein